MTKPGSYYLDGAGNPRDKTTHQLLPGYGGSSAPGYGEVKAKPKLTGFQKVKAAPVAPTTGRNGFTRPPQSSGGSTAPPPAPPPAPAPVAPTGPAVTEHGGRYKDKVFGNVGAIKDAANASKAGADQFNQFLSKDRRDLEELRTGIRDPTGTKGFASIMNLAGERLGHATEAEREQQAEATSRRGYVGGYNPAVSERNRLEALALAGGEASQGERETLQKQFGMEGSLYDADVGAYGGLMRDFNQAMTSYGSTPTESWSSDLGTSNNPEWDAYLAKLGINARASEGALDRGAREREQGLDLGSRDRDRDYNRERDEANRADAAAQAEAQRAFEREQTAYQKERDDADRAARLAQQQAQQVPQDNYQPGRGQPRGRPSPFASYDPFIT